jgi:hypothetical protein
MAEMKVSVVHDEFGEIVSVSRLERPNVIVLAKDGQSVFVTDVDEESIENMIHTYRVDGIRKSLVAYGNSST